MCSGGATIGTLGRPEVEGFGGGLARLVGNWTDSFPNLAGAVRDMDPPPRQRDDWNLDRLWTRVDYYAKHAPALGSHPHPGDVSIELHRAVATVYGGLDQAVLADFLPRTSLHAILTGMRAGDLIVSLSWDTLVEFVAERVARDAGLRLVQAPHPCGPGDVVVFAKPHGSLAWRRPLLPGPDPPIMMWGPAGTPLLDPVPADQIRVDGNCLLQPLLLGAVPIKSELIREVQAGCPHIYEIVMSQWRVFCDAFARADRIVVVGYRFPPEDAYGSYLLSEAARRRRERVAVLELWTPRDEAAAVLANISRVLGDFPLAIHPRGPVEAPPELKRRHQQLAG